MGDGSTNPARLAVLLSGSGRSLENLIEHIERGTLDADDGRGAGSGDQYSSVALACVWGQGDARDACAPSGCGGCG